MSTPASKSKPIKCVFCGAEFHDKYDDEYQLERHITENHISPSFRRSIRNVFKR